MEEIEERIKNLPFRQQIALWSILRMYSGDSNFSFFSSGFAKKLKKFIPPVKGTDLEEYGRFIGGILSGLYRNGLLKRVSGGRDKGWTLSPDVVANIGHYKKYLFEVKTYWAQI